MGTVRQKKKRGRVIARGRKSFRLIGEECYSLWDLLGTGDSGQAIMESTCSFTVDYPLSVSLIDQPHAAVRKTDRDGVRLIDRQGP